MPTKIVADLTANTITEVELEGAELQAYNDSLAAQEAERLAAEQAAQQAAPQETQP